MSSMIFRKFEQLMRILNARVRLSDSEINMNVVRADLESFGLTPNVPRHAKIAWKTLMLDLWQALSPFQTISDFRRRDISRDRRNRSTFNLINDNDDYEFEENPRVRSTTERKNWTEPEYYQRESSRARNRPTSIQRGRIVRNNNNPSLVNFAPDEDDMPDLDDGFPESVLNEIIERDFEEKQQTYLDQSGRTWENLEESHPIPRQNTANPLRTDTERKVSPNNSETERFSQFMQNMLPTLMPLIFQFIQTLEQSNVLNTQSANPPLQPQVSLVRSPDEVFSDQRPSDSLSSVRGPVEVSSVQRPSDSLSVNGQAIIESVNENNEENILNSVLNNLGNHQFI